MAGRKVRVQNVQQGFYNATGFHPIRSSSDYDSERLSDDSEGGYTRRRKPAKKKAKAKARKKNPSGFPVGRLVKVKAVRVNKNGTISVVR